MKILHLDHGIERIVRQDVSAPGASRFPSAKSFAPSGVSVINHLSQALSARVFEKKIADHLCPSIGKADVLFPENYASSFEDVRVMADRFPANDQEQMEVKENMKDLMSNLHDFHQLLDTHRKSLLRG